MGLDGIKDTLCAQSPDLQMDPSELLNLFIPDGPITTDPRSPLSWDDLFEFSDSAKDALTQSLGLGPARSLMAPPDQVDDDSNG
jgi:hypothetical protein